MAVASYFIHCNVSSFSSTNKRKIWQEDGGNVIVKADQLCAYKDIRRFFKKVIFGVVFSVIFYFILDFKYLVNIQIIDIYLKKNVNKNMISSLPSSYLEVCKRNSLWHLFLFLFLTGDFALRGSSFLNINMSWYWLWKQTRMFLPSTLVHRNICWNEDLNWQGLTKTKHSSWLRCFSVNTKP